MTEAEQVRKKVCVIDDDLAPPTYAQLPEELHALLGDSTSPEYEAVLAAATRVLALDATDVDSEPKVQKLVQSGRFVQKVLYDDNLYGAAPPKLQQQLANIREKQSHIHSMLSVIADAFPADRFDLTKLAERPADPKDLLDYDLLLLDLVMGTDEPITDICSYLHRLSEAAGDVATVPSIILISQRSADLAKYRVDFRMGGQISAAGLCIVEKSRIVQPEFGRLGLQLLWLQMERQKEVAGYIRQMCRALDAALSEAHHRTMQMFWNLDAAALQQIHLTAWRDNDPFDEHFQEYLEREHIWHVEQKGEVRAKLNALSDCFDKELEGHGNKAEIAYRFSAHSAGDMAGMRDVTRHYLWRMTPMIYQMPAFKGAIETDEFNLALPFGTVLVGNDSSQALIHLTQECDLNKRTPYKRDISLIFVRAGILSHNAKGTGESTSIRLEGLIVGNDDVDLEAYIFKPLAIPIREFLGVAETQQWRVVGRLRRDVSRQIVQAVAANATRLAAFTRTKGMTPTALVCLRIGQERGDAVTHWYCGDSGTDKPRSIVVSETQEKTASLLFVDEESTSVTMWVAATLSKNGRSIGDDADKLCADLCDGLRNGIGTDTVVGNLGIELRRCPADEVDKVANTIAARSDKLKLVILRIEDSVAAAQPSESKPN